MYVVRWEKLCDSKGRGLGWAPVRGISEGPVVGDRPSFPPGVCSLGALDCGLRPGTVSCWLKLFVGFGERKDNNNTCFVVVLYIFLLCFMPSWSGSNESLPYFCRLGNFMYPGRGCHTSSGSQSMVMMVGFCPCTYPLTLSPVPTKGSLPLHHENKNPKAISWVVCAVVCQWTVVRWAGFWSRICTLSWLWVLSLELPLVMSFLWDLEGYG